MKEREFDKREFTPEEKRVLKIFEEELRVIYTGNLWVRKARDPYTGRENGYELELSLNNLDKPQYITYIGDSIEEFFRLVRMQIREDNIASHVMYTYGRHIDPTKDC